MMQEILGVVDRCTPPYAGALWTYALVGDSDRPSLLRGALRFSPKDLTPREPRDYTGLLLREQWFPLEAATKFLESLATGSTSGFDLKGTHAWSRSWRGDSVPLPSRDRSLLLPVSAFVYAFSPTATHIHAPSGPMVHLEHPVFSDGNEAADDWMGIRDPFLNNGLGVSVVLPDVRGAIRKVRIGEDEVEVEIEVLAADVSDLKVRATLWHDRDVGSPAKSLSLPFERKGGTFVAPFEGKLPRRLDIYLLDQRNSTIVDWQQFREVASTSDGFLEVSVPTKELIEIISAGETQRVELKQQVNDRAVESITAFANGEGGLIIIGVNDERQVVGIDNPAREASKLQDMVNTLADPVPVYETSYKEIHGENVIVIRVSSGPNRPYTVRGRGTFVRRKDRNVAASRHDLDAMYSRREQGNTIPNLRRGVGILG